MRAWYVCKSERVFLFRLFFTGFAYMTKDKTEISNTGTCAFLQSAQIRRSVCFEGGAQDVSESVRGICSEAGGERPSRVGSRTGTLASHLVFLRNLQDCQTVNGIASRSA